TEIEGGFAGVRHGAGAQGHPHRAHVLGHPGGDAVHCLQVVAAFGGRTGDLFHQHGAGHASAPGGVQGVLHGHVVGDHHRLDRDVLEFGQFGGGLEVEHVAGVVLHDVQDAGTTVGGLGGGLDLVGGGRGEHRAGHGRIQHAAAHETGVQWLVSAAAAADDADLARDGPAGAGDE